MNEFLKQHLQNIYQEMFPEYSTFWIQKKGCCICAKPKPRMKYSGYIYPGFALKGLKVCKECFKVLQNNEYNNILLTQKFLEKALVGLKDYQAKNILATWVDFINVRESGK